MTEDQIRAQLATITEGLTGIQREIGDMKAKQAALVVTVDFLKKAVEKEEERERARTDRAGNRVWNVVMSVIGIALGAVGSALGILWSGGGNAGQ